uniref:cytochrome c biogenesis heme-transporting ATPase CcmA n=1 Tax=Endozoicomonas sp. Mp262 TaxID=2919499 RepID=UPI00351ADF11
MISKINKISEGYYLLEVANLECERDDRMLFADLSFSVMPGETLQVEGCNGSGKTTLLKILAGLTQDYQGTVLWGKDLLNKNYAEFRLACHFIGHYPGIKNELSPMENLTWRQSISGRKLSNNFTDALAEADLAGYEYIPCGSLSAGQQRRVALAGLLVSDARLWILDEPFTAIDSSGIDWVERLLEQHARQGGMTVITSHQALSESLAGLRTIRLDQYSGIQV